MTTTDQFPADEAGQREKARANRAMFDAIAPRYDQLNRLMSLGLDGGWRKRLVDQCALQPGMRVLDLCCGTGDVTREAARRGARVIGLDASAGMLAIARRRSPAAITFTRGDALRLPFPDGTFDAVTIAFGNRNVASLERLYAEMRRVAAPGGRIVSLEAQRPPSPLFARLFFLYFRHLPPLLARLTGADPLAYAYLPASVLAYPTPDQVTETMHAAGLVSVRYQSLLGGALALHRGVAPA